MATVTYSESTIGSYCNNRTVKVAIEASNFKQEFYDALSRVLAQTNRHEDVYVHFWYAPFVYIEVKDRRWKHYPCGCRFLVSFDLTNGKLASTESENRYTFARKGWVAFATALVGYSVTRYSDCGNPECVERC